MDGVGVRIFRTYASIGEMPKEFVARSELHAADMVGAFHGGQSLVSGFLLRRFDAGLVLLMSSFSFRRAEAVAASTTAMLGAEDT